MVFSLKSIEVKRNLITFLLFLKEFLFLVTEVGVGDIQISFRSCIDLVSLVLN